MKKAPIFEAEVFAGNRRRLRKLSSASPLIVITANGALQSDSYSPFPFRQDSNFWYLTGVNDPDTILVMDGDSEYLVVPQRTERQIIFDGELDYESMRATSGIDTILFGDEGWSRLGKRLKRAKQIATLKPSPVYVPELAMYSNPARRVLVRKLKSHHAELQMTDLRPQLAAMRMIKSKPEVAAIQYAIDYTAQLYKLVAKNLAHYESEQDLAADVSRYLIQNQLNYAYAPIIAGGVRATVLHYNANNAPLKAKECVLLDIGAAVSPYYCADITRTITLKPGKRALAVHAAVLAVQEFAIGYLKPGVLLRDYEVAVNKLMGEKLLELGLIRDTDQESIRHFYPHGTSHFLGLDVHDVGDYTASLQAGMVLTVEPGIYIKDESIGIRIEDDILITKTGSRVLSAHLPKSLSAPTMSAS